MGVISDPTNFVADFCVLNKNFSLLNLWEKGGRGHSYPTIFLHTVSILDYFHFSLTSRIDPLCPPPSLSINHIQERTYLCILATNVATEKVFIFLWFWWVVQIWISMCQIFSCISSGISFWSRSASVPSYTMRFCFYPGKYHFFPSDHNNDV